MVCHLPVESPGGSAVVSREHNDGVLQHARPPERPRDVTHGLVQGGHHGRINPPIQRRHVREFLCGVKMRSSRGLASWSQYSHHQSYPSGLCTCHRLAPSGRSREYLWEYKGIQWFFPWVAGNSRDCFGIIGLGWGNSQRCWIRDGREGYQAVVDLWKLPSLSWAWAQRNNASKFPKLSVSRVVRGGNDGEIWPGDFVSRISSTVEPLYYELG